jgi:hypothetical protein
MLNTDALADFPSLRPVSLVPAFVR